MSNLWRFGFFAVIVLSLVAVGFGLHFLTEWLSPLPSIADLEKHLRDGEYDPLYSKGKRLLKSSPDSDRLLMMVGEASQRLQKWDESVHYYRRVSEDNSVTSSVAKWAIGEIYFNTGKLSESLNLLNESLERNPKNTSARERRAEVYRVAGMNWDSSKDIQELASLDMWGDDYLFCIADIWKEWGGVNRAKFAESSSTDPLFRLGQAVDLVRKAEYEEAESILTAIIQEKPKILEAHVQLGKILVAQGKNPLHSWNIGLPANAESHPEVWWIRGKALRREDELRGAVRCFSESLRLDPDYLPANEGMAQSLSSLGETELAKKFARRSVVVEKYVGELNRINIKSKYFPPLESLCVLASKLGRESEAWAWARIGYSTNPDRNSPLVNIYRQFEERLKQNRIRLPWRTPEAYTVRGNDFHDFPLPDWNQFARDVESKTQPISPADVEVTNSAIPYREPEHGIRFTYFPARAAPVPPGRRMHEVTGGGVGVLDYDNDNWPDLFFAQGTHWPIDTQMDHPPFVDKIYRNVTGEMSLGTSKFVDVSRECGIAENGFGQGVATGDINSDGFQDVYVANVGQNQWWINQGDGTFSNGNGTIDTPPDAWTISATIVDLNGDGLAEVYDARYVEGPRVYEQLCNVQGEPRTCPPNVFQPSKGRLQSPSEEGKLVDISSEAIHPNVQEGCAYGLVALRLAKDEHISLFIANDQVPNLLLHPIRQPTSSFGFRFEDQGVVRGVAFAANGRAQACMGIAAGDVNGDGLVDMLVTNFFREYNTLYVQQSDGAFEDRTSEAGLVKPTLEMLGFGAQFLDIELDGDLDLIVLNGHVDDMSHVGEPFRMRPQVFLNDGNGNFAEWQDPKHPFFSAKMLGRALATADFNRDGRIDFVATDLESPAHLLENSTNTNSFIGFRCVGTQSHRDAIGTRITIRVGNKQQTQQLMGGNGYMVSNEKRIDFGLGSSETIDQVKIDWPSGRIEEYEHLPANSTWLLVEGLCLSRVQ